MTTVNAPKVSMDMKGSGTFFKKTNIEFKNQVFQGYALKRQKGDTLKTPHHPVVSRVTSRLILGNT
jgi:hypothetical protein